MTPPLKPELVRPKRMYLGEYWVLEVLTADPGNWYVTWIGCQAVLDDFWTARFRNKEDAYNFCVCHGIKVQESCQI